MDLVFDAGVFDAVGLFKSRIPLIRDEGTTPVKVKILESLFFVRKITGTVFLD